MSLATRARDHKSPSSKAAKKVASHRRPVHTFRAIGVFVLVLGAVVGIYVGVGESIPEQSDATSVALVDPAADLGTEKAAIRDRAVLKARAAAVAAAKKAAEAEAVAKRNAERAASRSQNRTTYPVPESCDEYSGNRALGCALLLAADFGLEEMPCLEKLWTKESGWNPKSHNSSSGAHGIPQALPGSKMAQFGDDWETNPVTQIKWGLSYITNRYKTPCNAWSHFQNNNWY